ncbi:MAG: bifunctional hydroxymethylpyrimidine kinase/phosphomethylpyrimidine kinase [Opitutales bacterium]|nr:bifunctional hydroxymethylpyrimidine kinase/phosphomethylpyrimidine kinase [Opitutales bacterium]
MKKTLATALTVAGSDSGAGAGVQADLLTFAARGVWGTTVLTALTAQNPDRVSGILPVPANFLKAQLDAVVSAFPIAAMKTGMLGDLAAIEAIVRFHKRHPSIKLVVDPVMVATSGAKLFSAGTAMDALTKKLIPRATLVTPNLDEAAILLGQSAGTVSAGTVETALELFHKFGVPVLLKGGHGSGTKISDILVEFNGDVSIFTHRRLKDINTHGSGCTLSAAITAELSKGKPLRDSVQEAIEYLQAAMKHSAKTPAGNFIAHLQKCGKD